jgi:hypothetical protein
MIAGSSCECLICRLEKDLVAKLGEERTCADYRALVAPETDLSSFSSPAVLVEELHRRRENGHNPKADLLLSQILKENSRADPHPIWQHLLIVAFIPTIHRTTTQVAFAFSSLPRDDVAQHVLTLFLENLASHDLKARDSHIAFTVARALRRKAFRWAIQQSRSPSGDELNGDAHDAHSTPLGNAFGPPFLLNEFLDACERARLVSPEERRLIHILKIEGISCAELARHNGHTTIATKRRIQRVIERLRTIAASKALPKQLELFSKSESSNR